MAGQALRSTTDNCTVFSDAQYKQLAVSRGASSAVFFILTLTVLFLTLRVRSQKTFQEKLILYVIVVLLIRTGLFMLQMIEEAVGDSSKFCQAMGFFIEWAGWVQLSTVLFLALYHIYLLMKVVKSPQEEIAHHNPSKCQYLALIFGWTPLPLLFVWIPFSGQHSDNEVSSSTRCWLASISEDCSDSIKSFVEEVVIWYTPLVVAAWFCLHLALYLTIIYCIMSARYAKLRREGPWHWVLILTHILFSALCGLELAARMSTGIGRHYSFSLWFGYAVASTTRDFVLVCGYSIYLYRCSLCGCMENRLLSRARGESEAINRVENSFVASAFVNIEAFTQQDRQQLLQQQARQD